MTATPVVMSSVYAVAAPQRRMTRTPAPAVSTGVFASENESVRAEYCHTGNTKSERTRYGAKDERPRTRSDTAASHAIAEKASMPRPRAPPAMTTETPPTAINPTSHGVRRELDANIIHARLSAIADARRAPATRRTMPACREI